MNDKVQHALAGLFAGFVAMTLYAAFVLVCAFALPTTALIPVPFIGALIAGITKEGADWLDNRTLPGSHSVDPWDVVATAAPGAALSALIALVVITR